MTTNGIGGQTESAQDIDTGELAQDTQMPEGTASDVSAEDVEDRDGHHHDDEDQAEEGGDQDGGSRRSREAHYRRRAQAAEAERDQLRAQLDTLHRQIMTKIASDEGLPEVELLESAGYELSSFVTDEGKVDRSKLIEATSATMRRYNIRKPGTLLSNPQQGARGVPATSAGVAGVIKGALGR